MKVITNFLILLVILFGNVNLGAAQKPSSLENVVGSKASNELIHILEKSGADLNKPTIINFWATWCVPCIRELKLLNTILDNTDDLNVLSVTYEEGQKVSQFLERYSDMNFHNLNILPADTLFIKFFPHRLLPHNIWLDRDGVIQHITGGTEITEENIYSFIEGIRLEVTEKHDILDFNPFEPFRHSDSDYVYRSIITKEVKGLPSGQTFIPVGFADKIKVQRVFFFNYTLEQMLTSIINLRKARKNHFNTMRIITNDSLRFFSTGLAPESFATSKYETKDDWRAENLHCYELSLPAEVKDTLFFSYMLEDLKRNFNFEVDVVEDSITCSIITKDNSIPLTYNQEDSTFLRFYQNELIVENVDVLSLFQEINETLKPRLNSVPEDPPFIDRTGGVRLSFVLKLKEGIPRYRYVKNYIEKEFGIKVHHEKAKHKITIIKDIQ